jgi:2-phospho-L-lactate guanylyltransferase
MLWRAVVPLKLADRKTRLAGRFDEAQRSALAEDMAAHVVSQIAASTRVRRISVLSPRRDRSLACGWIEDLGRGLNAELDAARDVEEGAPLFVMFADLPLVSVADVEALLEAAERNGAAIAPDRHGQGTNALALADGAAFRFAFGTDSFGRHRDALPHSAIVRTAGLGLDVDTPADWEEALALGYSAPVAA